MVRRKLAWLAAGAVQCLPVSGSLLSLAPWMESAWVGLRSFLAYEKLPRSLFVEGLVWYARAGDGSGTVLVRSVDSGSC